MNILTFDIEEWIVYDYFNKGGKDFFLPILNNYLGKILDLLDEHNYKATFFCLGQLAKNYPGVIKQIIGQGHDIGCHSNAHRLITTLDQDTFYKDTFLAIKYLEDVCGKKITAYRAPAFSITEQNKWAFKILIDLGITHDSSIFPALRSFERGSNLSFYQPFIIEFNKKELKEFPVNIIKIAGKNIVFSGGGYFRLVPYAFIKKWTNESTYIMTYFHIRDFDKEQKVIFSTRYFKSYYGIKHTMKKFQQYLTDFSFVTLEKANQEIDWESVPIINL